MTKKLLTILSILLVFGFALAALTACSGTNSASNATTAPAGGGESEEVAQPSNPGGPGQAVSLTGDPTAGAQVYADKCKECHGEEGKGGVANPGSDDGTIPPLNPIDPTLVSADQKTFATNIDLFIEHGSKPEGDNPAKSMAAFGDEGKLTPQQIADVIAYIISLNK